MENNSVNQPQFQRNTAIAEAFLKKYTKQVAPKDFRKALVGVIMFCFGTLVTAAACLGPNAGPRTAMSYILPGFFVIMTLVMALELRDHYQWRRNEKAYTLKQLIKEAPKHVEVRYALGYAYLMGSLGVQDSAQAAQWYQKAAGYAFADNDLGVSYALGEGVDKDLHKAHKLFKDAAKSGAMFASDNLKLVKDMEQF